MRGEDTGGRGMVKGPMLSSREQCRGQNLKRSSKKNSG